uniref:Fungal lipase-like domain-containing protein n=1 Tax=Panagrolaimus davidi TaxID=227884 RepID=A0A914PCB5_9BILA
MKSVVSFLLFLFVTSVYSSYNETLARYFVWPMASAAFSDHPELCVKDNYKSSEFKRRISVKCDLTQSDTCVGFTAVSHSDKAIIISFRGSQGSEVAMEVIDGLLMKPVAPFSGGGNVNEYFINAFDMLWLGGLKDDFLTLKNANPGYVVWITGHSLGAAIASIAATTIAHTKLISPDMIKLITYGEPRVGDKTYAELSDSLLPYTYRVVHKHDIVPHLPPKGFRNYYHHKSEVWYNNNMAVGQTWVECDVDEGDKCSDSTLDLVPNDHDDYFNIDTGFANNGCKGWNIYNK